MSLHYERKPSTWRAFVFTAGKKLQQKTFQLNVPIPLYRMNIRKLIKDDEFINSMNYLELHTWTSFVDVVKNFLDNRQAKNYKNFMEKLLKSLQDKGTNMNIKVHFLLSHLDKFLDNSDNVSNEQREWFHQDIKTMKECYQRWWDKPLIFGLIWIVRVLRFYFEKYCHWSISYKQKTNEKNAFFQK